MSLSGRLRYARTSSGAPYTSARLSSDGRRVLACRAHEIIELDTQCMERTDVLQEGALIDLEVDTYDVAGALFVVRSLMHTVTVRTLDERKLLRLPPEVANSARWLPCAVGDGDGSALLLVNDCAAHLLVRDGDAPGTMHCALDVHWGSFLVEAITGFRSPLVRIAPGWPRPPASRKGGQGTGTLAPLSVCAAFAYDRAVDKLVTVHANGPALIVWPSLARRTLGAPLYTPLPAEPLRATLSYAAPVCAFLTDCHRLYVVDADSGAVLKRKRLECYMDRRISLLRRDARSDYRLRARTAVSAGGQHVAVFVPPSSLLMLAHVCARRAFTHVHALADVRDFSEVSLAFVGDQLLRVCYLDAEDHVALVDVEIPENEEKFIVVASSCSWSPRPCARGMRRMSCRGARPSRTRRSGARTRCSCPSSASSRRRARRRCSARAAARARP